MNIANLEKEYARTIKALNQAGILTLLPRLGNLGVIGIDGKEYPVPTQEQVQELFTNNEELVNRTGLTQESHIWDFCSQNLALDRHIWDVRVSPAEKSNKVLALYN